MWAAFSLGYKFAQYIKEAKKETFLYSKTYLLCTVAYLHYKIITNRNTEWDYRKGIEYLYYLVSQGQKFKSLFIVKLFGEYFLRKLEKGNENKSD